MNKRSTGKIVNMDKKLRISLLILFATLISIGIYMRINALDNRSFFIDELYHVFAAESFNTTGEFFLPSGLDYPRAWGFTYFVSLSFKLFGVSESSARLPSAIFGLFYLVFFYFFIAKLFDQKLAILSTFFLLFSPLEIYYSSECRMYSMFQLTYLLSIILIYYIYLVLARENYHFNIESLKKILKDCHIMPLGLILSLGISLHLQPLSLLIFPSIVVFLIALTTEHFYKKSNLNQMFFGPLLGVLSCVCIFAIYLFRERIVQIYLKMGMGMVPEWAMNEPENTFWYLSKLMKYESFYLWLFIPLGIGVGVTKKYRPTAYLLSLFAIPLILLSFHPWKEIRYIYHFYPFFHVFIAIGLLVFFKTTIKIFLTKKSWLEYGISGCFLLLTFSFITTKYVQSFNQSQIHLLRNSDWKSFASQMNISIKKEDIIITDNSIAVNYYLGRVDYIIDANILEISKEWNYRAPSGRWLDGYTNAVHITSIKELEELFEKGQRIWVFLGHRTSGFKNIKQYIRKTGRYIENNTTDTGIEIYRLNAHEKTVRQR